MNIPYMDGVVLVRIFQSILYFDVFTLEIVELHPLHRHDLIALRKMKDEKRDPSYFVVVKQYMY